MANALAEAADIESTIDSGEKFGDARFRFADEVGVQLLPPLDDPSWMEKLRDAQWPSQTSRSAQRRRI